MSFPSDRRGLFLRQVHPSVDLHFRFDDSKNTSKKIVVKAVKSPLATNTLKGVQAQMSLLSEQKFAASKTSWKKSTENEPILVDLKAAGRKSSLTVE